MKYRLDSYEFYELINDILDEAMLNEFPMAYIQFEDDTEDDSVDEQQIMYDILNRIKNYIDNETERRLEVSDEYAREIVYQTIKDYKDE